MKADIWTEGFQARHSGKRAIDNPYCRDDQEREHVMWLRGFNCKI